MGGKVRATVGDFGTQNFEGYFNLGGETAARRSYALAGRWMTWPVASKARGRRR